MDANDIRGMTALELGKAIRDRTISSPEATRVFLDASLADANRGADGVNAYISIDEEGAMAAAADVQRRIDAGDVLSPIAGVPTAVKDNICVNGGVTTAASKMLEHFSPPYNATVIDKLKEAGAVILGKTNMDEFAMGGSTETSYFGVTANPWDRTRVSGGSSGGSAAAVAAGFAPYAIGSDTGGSIRQPCAFCNLTGVKPTYGSVSRFGLMAYASSLDQIGSIARDARDCAVALSVLSGPDEKDSTSVIDKPLRLCGAIHGEGAAEGLKGLKIGLPQNCLEEGLADDVRARVSEASDTLRALGAEVESFTLPLIEYAVPAYYIIACAEAGSNLSRYDGVKYGFRSDAARDMDDIFYRSRSEGFGTEVKRRIMLGSFVLSSGYFDAYYKKALQVRGMIKETFDEAFQRYDMVLSPVSPTVSYAIGGQIADPLAMYLADIYTVSVNLIGAPAVALPCGAGEGGLPVGMQFIGKAFDEETLLTAATVYQDATDHHRRRPPLKTSIKTTQRKRETDAI
ncbi:MAG: Asp-tRNA(Asn)/Glu-tRNA(Gln) amidotransferase subunit GatA [Clostridiales Family XIII bacterium]|jgi:aspartyl-tRNA(Asn)/glutamyl-tRNA(Gln) amidotransferase subunit A|nr:Asp-tRNA(Asn)/Glu-tRNA(Gln) amidotransferase subunit GatA [Clostridiales Family XIII bacterium]